MTDDWAIEAHDRDGGRFFLRPVAATQQVADLVSAIMTLDYAGGIVIYRTTVAPSNDFHNDVPDDHPGYLHVHSNGPDAEDCTTCGDCETEEEENPENFEKVASGNLPEDVELSNGITMKAGPVKIAYTAPDCCRICGRPPDDMPMVNRGTGWCCEKHRKELI